MKICEECPNYSPNAKLLGYYTPRPDVHCTDCGCNLNYKSKCLSCECPQGKWKAKVTEMEDAMLRLKLEESENKKTS